MTELEWDAPDPLTPPLPGMPDPGSLPGLPIPPRPPATSRDRRLTERRRAALDAGRHPHTGALARPDLGTCGTCSALQRQEGVAGRYLKCGRFPALLTRGAATDVRASWPACGQWRPRE